MSIEIETLNAIADSHGSVYSKFRTAVFDEAY